MMTRKYVSIKRFKKWQELCWHTSTNTSPVSLMATYSNSSCSLKNQQPRLLLTSSLATQVHHHLLFSPNSTSEKSTLPNLQPSSPENVSRGLRYLQRILSATIIKLYNTNYTVKSNKTFNSETDFLQWNEMQLKMISDRCESKNIIDMTKIE